MTVLVVALGFVVALLAVLVIGLLRSHAEILRRLHELGAGVYDADDGTVGVTSSVALSDGPAPERAQEKPQIRTQPGVAEPRPDETPASDLAGVTAAGAAKAVGVVGTEHSTLLAFLSTGCGTCHDFWRAFAAGEAAELPGRDTRLVIVTKGPDEESPSAVSTLAPDGLVTLMSSEAYRDYGVPVSPYFILVDGPTGRILGEGAAASWAQVANLLRQAAGDAGLLAGRRSAAARAGRPAHLDGPERESRADAELLAAGITPGHASLYPDSLDEAVPAAEPEEGGG